MICPNCGTEQRESDRCVQCAATLPSRSIEKEPLKISSSKAPSPPVSKTQDGTSALKESEINLDEKRKKPNVTEKPERKQVRVVEPERRPKMEEGAQKVLITTTQKIEGRRISAYFGLISANIIIELEEQLSAIPDEKVFSMNAPYRSQMKTGVLLALRDLRGEAALLGANAVIATSFNVQRADPRSLLLSAFGTAVRIEEAK